MNRKRKPAIKSITAFLLSALLLFQTATAFAAAGTVSSNDTAGEEGTAKTVSKNEPSVNGEPEAGENQEEGEDTVSGQSLPEIQAGIVTGPENPVHHCTRENNGSDYADFDYVYFGSYPQGIVRDSALIAAIDKAIAASGTAADAGTDVWVNGAKYRRISKNDITNEYNFDDVKNNGYRYFKWERIKWKVLKNDGKTLFLVADKALDCKRYNEEDGSVTWENSTIRNWLNTYFYTAAFSNEEQSAIVEQTIVNEDNLQYDKDGGNSTKDKVYLLSLREVLSEEYGFCRYWNVETVSRRIKTSGYGKARGVEVNTVASSEGKGYCYWWLRSPGYNSDDAVCVGADGQVHRVGNSVNLDHDGVCPVLHINLSSACWFTTDDGTSGEGGGEEGKQENPKQIKVARLTLTAPSAKLAAGKTVALSLQVFPENAANKAVSFQTSNPKYASVDQTGKITIKKAGAGKNVTITASALDGSQVKASCKFKIMKHAVKKISLKAPAKTLKAGKTMTIKATVKTTGKSANKSLKWTSSNKKYAAVNSKGKVTAKKAGKGKNVTITAKSTDGSNKKAKVKIKIK